MERERYSLWDALFIPGTGKEQRARYQSLRDEGLIDSELMKTGWFNIGLCQRNIQKVTVDELIEGFSMTVPGNLPETDARVLELFDFFDYLYNKTSELWSVSKKQIVSAYLSTFLLQSIRDKRIAVDDLLLKLGDQSIDISREVVVVLVTLVNEDIITYDQAYGVASYYETRPRKNILREVLNAAFKDASNLCRNGYRDSMLIGLCLLAAITVSDKRLEYVMYTYIDCGITCEEMFNAFTTAFRHLPMTLQRRFRRTLLSACDKTFIDFDMSKLTPGAVQLIGRLIAKSNVEV